MWIEWGECGILIRIHRIGVLNDARRIDAGLVISHVIDDVTCNDAPDRSYQTERTCSQRGCVERECVPLP